MAEALESLLLKFDADTSAMRKALKEAEGGLERMEKNADRSLGNVKRRFDTFGNNINSSLSKVGAALAGFATVGFVSKMVDDVAKLSVAAETVGLSTKRYQELAAAARAASVDQGQFDSAIQKFAVSVAEAKTQTGGFYEFLRGSAPDVLRQIRQSKTLSEAFDVIAESVRTLDTSENKALMTKQAFGDGAVRMTKALMDGTAGLEAAAAAANKYGTIVSDDAIKATKALDDEIDKMTKSALAAFKEGLGTIAPYVTTVMEDIREVMRGNNPFTSKDVLEVDAGAAKRFYAEFTVAQKEGNTAVRENVEALNRSWAEATKITTLQIDPKKFRGAADALSGINQQLATLRHENAAAIGMANAKEVEDFRRMLEDKGASEAQFGEARKLLAQKKALEIAQFEKDRAREAFQAVTELKVRAAEASGRDLDAVDMQYDLELARFKEMLDKKIISEKEFQDMRSALSESTATKIKAVYDKETEEVRAMASELSGAFKSSIERTFDSLIEGSFKARDAVADLAKALGKAYLNRALLGPLADGIFGKDGSGGLLSGVVGSLIPRAHGGPMTAGVPYIAGERGPEMIVPRTQSQAVAPWQASPSATPQNITYNIDARGAAPGVSDDVVRAIQATRAPDAITAQRAYAKRFPARR